MSRLITLIADKLSLRGRPFLSFIIVVLILVVPILVVLISMF
jgi:hypothetical protein